MKRCPKGQRRHDGKCVYNDLYEDCKAVARRYRRGEPLRPMIDELLDMYALSKEEAEIRAGNDDEQEIAGGIDIYNMKKVRWDDVYYVMLGAGDGW
jgi:hypothetical protein